MTPDPPGPPALGTKVHEVVRSSGRDYVADAVVTELDPGVSYRFAGTGTIGGLEGSRSGLKKDLRKLKTLLEGER